ncbi:MAG: DUF6065 family protein [Sulfurifustis sp.]
MESIVTFHRIYPAAIPPMRADKSALGTLPTAAYQYCEAIRSASGFGWYVFPPTEIVLRWNGADVLHRVDGEWQALSSALLEDEFLEYWDTHAPPDLKGCSPPYLSSLFVPGIVQIWSGLLIGTAKDWAVLIRPPANVPQSAAFACYEGIVETDEFRPCPLFVNIRLLATDRDIVIPKMKPLFQVQPLPRVCYSDKVMKHAQSDGLEPPANGSGGMSEADWEGFRRTVRSVEPDRTDHETGSYGANVRRRGKNERT